MSAMGEMPMPGGWTMSMAWMRMPGQTWPGAHQDVMQVKLGRVSAEQECSSRGTLW
jgi:hypothetical protein